MAKGGFNTPLLLLVLFLAGSIALVVTQGGKPREWHRFEPVASLPGERFQIEFPAAERPGKKVVQRQSKGGAFQETTYELFHDDAKYSVIVMPYTPEAIAEKNKDAAQALEQFQAFFCENVSPPWSASQQTPFTTAEGDPGLDYTFSFTAPSGKNMAGKGRLILTKACQFHLTAIGEDPDSESLTRFLASFEALPDKASGAEAAPSGASQAPEQAPEAPEAPEQE